jgi:hypothetical protein
MTTLPGGRGEGAYVQVADVAGDAVWTAKTPHAVTIVPARLLV